jgi:protein-disulfide isomerase
LKYFCDKQYYYYIFYSSVALVRLPCVQHAAEAAESIAAQNKFWEMHDYLYEHQQALDDNHLEKYASKLGL